MLFTFAANDRMGLNYGAGDLKGLLNLKMYFT